MTTAPAAANSPLSTGVTIASGTPGCATCSSSATPGSSAVWPFAGDRREARDQPDDGVEAVDPPPGRVAGPGCGTLSGPGIGSVAAHEMVSGEVGPEVGG